MGSITLDILGERLANFQGEMRGDMKEVKAHLHAINGSIGSHDRKIVALETRQKFLLGAAGGSGLLSGGAVYGLIKLLGGG